MGLVFQVSEQGTTASSRRSLVYANSVGDQTTTRMWRRARIIALRSSSLRPPQMPRDSPFVSAQFRQSCWTGQPRQTRLAWFSLSLRSPGDSPLGSSGGKNRFNPQPRHAARSLQFSPVMFPPMDSESPTFGCFDQHRGFWNEKSSWAGVHFWASLRLG